MGNNGVTETSCEEDTPLNWLWLGITGVSVISLGSTMLFAMLTFKRSRRHVFNIIMLTAALLGRYMSIFVDKVFTVFCMFVPDPKPVQATEYFTAAAYLWIMIVNLNSIHLIRNLHQEKYKANHYIIYGFMFVAGWGIALLPVVCKFAGPMPEPNAVAFMVACLFMNSFLVAYLIRKCRQIEPKTSQVMEEQPEGNIGNAAEYAKGRIGISIVLWGIMILIYLDQVNDWYYLEMKQYVYPPPWTFLFKGLSLSAPIGLWGCFCFSKTTKQRLQERFGRK